jgi:histidine triad (HIT) family protein
MDDCIFCQIAAGKAPSWKVLESGEAYAFLDIHPVNAYHTLVVPKRHYRDIFDVPADELQGLMSLLKRVVDLYAEKIGLTHAQIHQ